MGGGRADLRKQSVAEPLSYVENAFGVQLESVLRKRRSVGARTASGRWVRIEVRPWARILREGQSGNGVEAAARFVGVARPRWYRGMSWDDPAGECTWRADEMECVTAAPIRSGGPLPADVALSDAWWRTLNTSLDALAGCTSTRVATPDIQPMSQALVADEINKAFPGQVDTSADEQPWTVAHADLNWSNITGPDCRILDWEDHGMAPGGLDAANLWIASLSVPSLAARVRRERAADLESRSGRLMSLFCAAKILNDASTPAALAARTAELAGHLIDQTRHSAER